MAGAPTNDSSGSGIAAPVLSVTDFVKLARADLYAFLALTFGVLHPGDKLVYAPYLEVMATLLMSVADGRKRRVILNLPPRHMKSMLVSVYYVAWRLGRDPAAKFICISYGDDLAHDLSASCRKLMLSPLYHRIFPNTVLDKKAVDHITTTQGGRRYATAVGSDITGFGADEIIMDDLLEPEQATSELAKNRVLTWTSSSVLTRFNDPENGKLIFVGHRLAPDDFSATLEATGLYYVLKLPLIADVERPYIDRHKRVVMRRQPGEVLNPTRLSVTGALALKATLPGHVWAAQYQQKPTFGGSGMLSMEHIRRYDRAKAPAFELIIHSWDIGATVTGNASVCTKWGLVRDGGTDTVYLTDVIRLQVELPAVRAAIKAQDRADHPALIVLDERGVGLGIRQDLWEDGYRHVQGSMATSEPLAIGDTGVKATASKVDRFGKATLAFADGRVLIPTQAPWLEKFLYELLSFPNIEDKDQVDSVTQLVANLTRAVAWARQGHRPAHL